MKYLILLALSYNLSVAKKIIPPNWENVGGAYIDLNTITYSDDASNFNDVWDSNSPKYHVKTYVSVFTKIGKIKLWYTISCEKNYYNNSKEQINFYAVYVISPSTTEANIRNAVCANYDANEEVK